jgi:hypothetical protein
MKHAKVYQKIHVMMFPALILLQEWVLEHFQISAHLVIITTSVLVSIVKHFIAFYEFDCHVHEEILKP